MAGNLRACARERCHATGERIVVQLVGAVAKTRYEPGVIYVKEAQARSSKESRAEPVAALYEKGLVVHVKGADLSELENEWTTWDPESGKSPNNLDACVWALWELAGLAADEAIKGDPFAGVGLMRNQLRNAARPGAMVSTRVGSFLPRLGTRASRL